MARFAGLIGFAQTVRTAPGVSSESMVEKGPYFGDVKRTAMSVQTDNAVNPGLSTTNTIEVVADDFLSGNASAIRYVEWAGTLWQVTEITEQRPRLLLRLGGVYAGPRA